MVGFNGKDLAIFIVVTFIAGTILVAGGAVDLLGSQTVNGIDFIPGVGTTSPSEDAKYKMTSCVEYSGEVESLPDPNNQQIVEDSVKVKTVVDKDLLSIASLSQLSLSGTKDVEITYILRDSSNRVVATDAKLAGEVGSGETVERCFETGNLESGSYQLEFHSSGTGFGVFGETGVKQDQVVKQVDVPNNPLGQFNEVN